MVISFTEITSFFIDNYKKKKMTPPKSTHEILKGGESDTKKIFPQIFLIKKKTNKIQYTNHSFKE